MPAKGVKTVLFIRDLRDFSGGHLKVWDYFNHVRNSAGHEPWVRFSKQTVWDASNPWHASRERVLGPRARLDPDILFLGGVDWLNLRWSERRRRRPVINLVQHIKHADPGDIRFNFLSRPAVRICVSAEVAEAIVATGRVNGPVFTIPNAVNLDGFPSDDGGAARDIDVLVVANKRPDLGRRLYERLQTTDRTVGLIDATLPRQSFLAWLRRSHVTVFVPNPTEGFYLPALEGMALGTVVVCADCVGNRSFCTAGVNCFRVDASEAALLDAVEHALQLTPPAKAALLDRGRATAARHSLGAERDQFLEILGGVENLLPTV